MAEKLTVSPSPHLSGEASTSRIMRDVVYALLPALAVSVLFFGVSSLLIAAIAIFSCVAFEWLIQKYLLSVAKPTINDCSALLTGLLLSFNLPASTPWWIVVIGSLVAIGVAKMTFGGLGKNPFNPALVGRVFLLIAYPVQMTSFPRVENFADAFSGATALSAVKSGSVLLDNVSLQDMFVGSIPGSLGEVSALFLILGGLYLLWRKVISWHIPVAVLATMFVFATICGLTQYGATVGSALIFSTFHIFAGGALLGAIYMATDYSTSPMTHKGMLVYGVGIGLITMVIRLWGAYPEGISFAILIMNAVTPLINKYIKPTRFGKVNK
ncbi:MAG: RnfABCDGE type electron transport complex subunit D [Rikenellaceae bacterium]